MKFLEKVQKYKKGAIICILLILTFLVGTGKELSTNNKIQVLGAKAHVIPSPTSILTPTTVPITIINNIYVPTQPVPSATPTPTPVSSTPTPTPSVMPTEAIFTPTPTVSPTPAPTPVGESVAIDIDYAGEHTESTYTVAITPGETAWQAVQDGIGLANIHYTDYGGDLGIFITGLNGIDASSNQYYDFQVNGASASMGVSSYQVTNNDTLRFVLTNF